MVFTFTLMNQKDPFITVEVSYSCWNYECWSLSGKYRWKYSRKNMPTLSFIKSSLFTVSRGWHSPCSLLLLEQLLSRARMHRKQGQTYLNCYQHRHPVRDEGWAIICPHDQVWWRNTRHWRNSCNVWNALRVAQRAILLANESALNVVTLSADNGTELLAPRRRAEEGTR